VHAVGDAELDHGVAAAAKGREAARGDWPPRRAGIVAPMSERLDIGRVLSRVFQYYREQAGLLLPAAAIIFVPIAIVNGAVYASGINLGLLVLTAVLGFAGSAWLAGMVVEAVRDIQDGRRDFDVGGLFRSVAPVFPALLAAGVLAGLGIGVGFILLIVPGLFLMTIWALVSPVVVIERPGVIPAFGRSRELVRGHGWQVLGVVVIVAISIAILRSILNGIAGSSDSLVAYAIADLVTNVALAPVAALAAAVMYFELRRMKGEPAVPAGAQPAGAVAGAPAGAASLPGVPGSTAPPPAAPEAPQPPPPPQPPPA
jgi:hypothetical protein